MFEAVLITIVAIIFAYLAQGEKRGIMLPIAFVTITIFLSLGYNWGPDVHTYEEWFRMFTDSRSSLFDFSEYEYLSLKGEYGYIFINQLCKPLGFYGMRALLFCFENLIIYLLVKRLVPKEYYWLAMFIYTMNYNFMILSSSMMRQWLAMCIVILAFFNLEKRRWFIYVFLVMLAASIHHSALISLPFVVLPYIADNFKKDYLLLLIPAFIVFYFLSDIIVRDVGGWLQTEDIYSDYTDAKYSSGIGIMNIVQFTIFVFIFFNIQKIEKSKKIYIAVLLFFGLILPLYIYSGLVARLSFYVTVFTIGVYPMFLKQAKMERLANVGFIWLIVAITLYNYFLFWTDRMWLLYYSKYTTLIEAGIIKI